MIMNLGVWRVISASPKLIIIQIVPPTKICNYFQVCILSGTPPECQDCKEEVNCSGGKGVQASSGEAGAGAGGGGGKGGVGGGGGGTELCAYECKARGGCTVRYTGPPRGGPSIGDYICIITKIIIQIITKITTIKVPASLLRLEVLAVELHPSAETATKPGSRLT